MKHLIIPDIHDKIDRARRIIDREPHDRRAFLGDFFDDFPTGAKAAAKTAAFVKEQLDDEKVDVLLGNHDLSYGWGNAVNDFACSGFTKSKWRAIHEVLKWDDWKKFKLHLWIPGVRRPWLLTHAGYDFHFLQDGQELVSTVDARCEFALRSLHSPNPFERGVGHTILGAGTERGGRQHRGGVLWCDWSKFEPPPGADQLVGHTPGRDVRVNDFPEAIAVCIDTGLRHYAVIDDGMLFVKDAPLED